MTTPRAGPGRCVGGARAGTGRSCRCAAWGSATPRRPPAWTATSARLMPWPTNGWTLYAYLHHVTGHPRPGLKPTRRSASLRTLAATPTGAAPDAGREDVIEVAARLPGPERRRSDRRSQVDDVRFVNTDSRPGVEARAWPTRSVALGLGLDDAAATLVPTARLRFARLSLVRRCGTWRSHLPQGDVRQKDVHPPPPPGNRASDHIAGAAQRTPTPVEVAASHLRTGRYVHGHAPGPRVVPELRSRRPRIDTGPRYIFQEPRHSERSLRWMLSSSSPPSLWRRSAPTSPASVVRAPRRPRQAATWPRCWPMSAPPDGGGGCAHGSNR